MSRRLEPRPFWLRILLEGPASCYQGKVQEEQGGCDETRLRTGRPHLVTDENVVRQDFH